jgi:A/G-specific adenine glycosylase
VNGEVIQAPDLSDATTIRTLQELVVTWYSTHRRDLPWRRTRDPYSIAVSEVMLQQTQVERVGPKYAEFLAQFPDWHTLAQASLGQVLRLWAPLGYNGRAVRLHKLAGWAVAHGAELPADEHAMRALPGLGPYTAAALAAFAFGQRTAVIDTNIRRVLARALLGEPYPRPALDRRLRPMALDLVPEEMPVEWHQALMDLGGDSVHYATAFVHSLPSA